MNNEIDLARQMRRLASAVPRTAGTNVEQQLIAAFRARHRQSSIYLAAAILACIACIVGLMRLLQPPVMPDRVYSAPGFIALPYSESGVPMESAVVIRVHMRSSELASLGVAMPAEPSTAKFKADLLVGQDGVPRAVRLVE